MIRPPCSNHADPITWRFVGTTSSLGQGSQYNGMAIAGLDFELRIFLDTDEVGIKPTNLSDVSFGSHQGEVEIETLGVLPVNMFLDVQYFAPSSAGGLPTGINYYQSPAPLFNDIMFPSAITSDALHLLPIPPTAPGLNNSLRIAGPDGLSAVGVVATFSATLEGPTSVPESGSTALLLTPALVALGFVRRRWARGRGSP
jgi:hypothetical protein